MADRYYSNADKGQRFQPGTTAESGAVDQKFDEVTAGFQKVATDTDRSLKLPDEGDSKALTETALQRRNKVVGFDKDGKLVLTAGFTWRGDWAADTEYFVNDVVVTPSSGNWYIAKERHTSGASFSLSYWNLGLDYSGVKATLESDLQPLVDTATGAATTATQKANQTAADRTQTGLDRQQTGEDRAAASSSAQTATEKATQTTQDRQQTQADRAQTGEDRQRTQADRQQTGEDRAAAGQSAATASQASAKSQQWAEAEGEVEPGQFSAYYWALVAEQKVTGDTPITSLAPGLLANPGDYPSVDEGGALIVRNVPADIDEWASAGTNPAALQRYDLAVNNTYSANDTTDVDLDLSAGPQVAIVGSSSLRTVNLTNPPSDRSILVIVYATGSAGISFPDLPNAGYWDGGEVPEAGDYWTQYLLWWVGFGSWRGSVGMKR